MTKTLNKNEELEWIEKAKYDPEVKQKLIEKFSDFIRKIASPFRRPNIDEKDLFNQGILGFERALQDFKPEMGNRFATYARFWVRAHIIEFYRQFSRPFTVTASLSKKISEILTKKEELEEILGREPTIEEIAARCKSKPDAVERLLNFSHSFISLNHSASEECEDDDCLEQCIFNDEVLSPCEDLINKDCISCLLKYFNILNDTERYILINRYGINCSEKTLEEVGLGVNLTGERVRQIQLLAENKLRKMFLK